MRLTVNGEPMEASADTLAALVEALGHEGATLATALNGRFVAAGARPATALSDGDAVEILAPMQGG